MNKTCARCEKTVYPTEELKCLDKVWHKGCFKCQECGMTLNMRTYKGYGKLPYCEAHVPKAKHTTMAETPELKRIAENTKLQSNVKYHADFEKSKGKFTQVADDPETLRIKANTRIISNVAYHGELEKKAQMEQKRLINENGELVELPTTDNYQPIDTYATELTPPQKSYAEPARQTPTNQDYYKSQNSNQNQTQKYDDNYYQYQTPPNPPPTQYAPPAPQYAPQQYNPTPNHANHGNHGNHSNFPAPPAQYQNYNAPSQNYAPPPQNYNPNPSQNYYEDYKYQYQQQSYGVGQNQKIGRIQDYDPLSDGPRAPPSSQRASATLIYNSTSDGRAKGAHQPQQQQQQQSRSIGRVTDMDPLAEEIRPQYAHAPSTPQAPLNQRVYVAMYDYEANDSDEVSFREGDLISDVAAIDGGWMTGRVLRTGRRGMLPANYVEIQPQH